MKTDGTHKRLLSLSLPSFLPKMHTPRKNGTKAPNMQANTTNGPQTLSGIMRVCASGAMRCVCLKLTLTIGVLSKT